jgi:cysteine desulfurase
MIWATRIDFLYFQSKMDIMKKRMIYLDYAATTPVDPAVLAAMKPYFSQKFGNPMSLHSFGRVASDAVEKAREQVADFLHCENKELIFTSGATESNNLAIKGAVEFYWKKYNRRPHIITSQIEHHCVLETCKSLEKNKLAEVTYLPVYKKGIVRVGDVKKAIRKNTVLISIMYVNNEIGTLQPIAEIGRMLKSYNLKTKKIILFHTDATQAVNYFDCNVNKLNVDLFSLSGHKIYGPKGVGVLYIKKGTLIKRIQDGGEQEFNLRAGTHNVPGIVGLGVAVSKIKNQKTMIKVMVLLRDYFIKKVLEEIPDSYLNGSQKLRSPNNANFRFENVEGESIVLMLDQNGIAVSTGSACSSGTLEPSHVLIALGLKREQSHGSLRITLGKDTKKADIDCLFAKLKESIKRIRKISGSVLEEFK